MFRHILDEDHIHEAIRSTHRGFYRETVDEVAAAVARDPIVVVGMAQNPFCRRARRSLERAGKDFTYLEYGSYLSQWRRRLALKMYTGWPTLPMVFVHGALIGGADDLDALLEAGDLDALLDAGR